MPSGLDQTPAAWRAKYGSLTLNAFHVDIPLGGMNETGLVVELTSPHFVIQSKC
jgi:penicillin V acylase-like amidase (Ntn superfamily)